MILYLGAIQIGLAYVLLTRAIRHVPAVEATTLLVIEPVLNPLWAWLIHGETPGLGPLAGGAVILSATLAQHLAGRKAKVSFRTFDFLYYYR